MSKKFTIVSIERENLNAELVQELFEKAVGDFGCDGVEEYSLEEKDVDFILKEKAFSGGDVKSSTLSAMELSVEKEELFFLKYSFSTENYAQRAGSFFEYLNNHYPNLTVMKREHDYQDWNQSFREHFKKIKVSEKIEIIPSWEKEPESFGKTKVFIYPGQGFGTGHHETTYLCLKLYSELIETLKSYKKKNCLDFGCGSGILGIAAKKANNFYVDFVDIDRTALENTVQNIDINFNQENLSGNSLVLRDRFEIKKTYQLIFANILEFILIEEKELLCESLCLDGYLIISGILHNQEKNIMDAFDALSMVQVLRRGDWSAILFKKEELS